MTGAVFEDVDGDGIQDANDDPIGGQRVYLDLNRNGKYDAATEAAFSDTSDAQNGAYTIQTGNLAVGENVAVRLDLDSDRVSGPPLLLGNSNFANDPASQTPLNGIGFFTEAQQLAGADFDGDGNTDLAVLHGLGSAPLSIFLADNNGRFSNTNEKRPSVGNAGIPDRFAVGHLNENDTPDIVTIDNGSSRVAILRDFDGTEFAENNQGFNLARSIDVTVGNFDNDDALEFVVLSEAVNGDAVVTVVQPNAALNQFTRTDKTLSGKKDPGFLVTGDFTNDDRLDVALFLQDSPDILVLPGMDDGTLGNPITSTILNRSFDTDIAAGQFAGSSDLDLAVVDGSTIYLLAGDGAGQFSLADTIVEPDGGTPDRLSAADLDGDGDTELAFTSIQPNGNQRRADAFMFENTVNGFVQRYRAFQINITYDLEKTAPILIGPFNYDDGDAESRRIMIAGPTQDTSSEFQKGLKFSENIFGKEYQRSLASTALPDLNFGVIPAVNTAPTITAIADQAVLVDQTTAALDFTVDDAESDATALTVIGSSSDEAIVKSENIVVQGNGADRNVTITPEPGQTGPVTVTLAVTDEDAESTSTTFELNVVPLPDVDLFRTQADGSTRPDGVQRSDLKEIVLRFGDAIALPAPGDVTLTNLGVDAPNDPDADIPIIANQLSLQNGDTELRIAFDTPLPSGVYQLSVETSVGPYTITGDSNNRFFVLAGDFDGDGIVGQLDLIDFADAFLKDSPPAPSFIDLEPDNRIDVFDLQNFADNFLAGIQYPAAPAGTDSLLVLDQQAPTGDVNGDHRITAIDALMIVNRLADDSVESPHGDRLDVNADGIVSARDALYVINRLDEQDHIVATATLPDWIPQLSDEDKLDAILEQLAAELATLN